MNKNYYYTIERPGIAEYKDRGSKFIAYAYPLSRLEDFKARLEEVKSLHPKATHHCFAYRLGTDKNNFRANDDGEPSGTAGKPILGQIDSKDLTNTLVIVVRYFGGTQLGVPGLINAYKTSAALVLQLIPAVQRSIEALYTLQFNYTQVNEVMTVIKKMNCSIIEQDMNLFCQFKVGIPNSRLDETLYSFKQIRDLEINTAN